MRLGGEECGFEYLFSEVVAEEIEDIASIVGGRGRVAEFIWHSNELDGFAAEIAAAFLANISDGILFDPQSGDWAQGRDAYALIESWRADERQQRVDEAEKKWSAVTERRCPECDSRCPEYRAKCWVCGHELGRLT
jgi:hydroxypyruvate isomerase